MTKAAGTQRLAILGAGNIGVAIAEGLVAAGTLAPDAIVLTRRRAGRIPSTRSTGSPPLAGARSPV